MDAPRERWIWLRRTRWRLRGAYQVPAFVLFTIVDAILLERLPALGDTGPGALGALLIAAFVNLFAVAVIGPLLGVWLRRRDAAKPAFAARDRGAVLALAAMCALLIAGGLANRGAVRSEAGDLRSQARAARSWFAHRAPDRYRSAGGEMTTWKAGEDLYRTCVPGTRPGRELCVYVATDQSPPAVTRDNSEEPNSRLAGPYGDIVVVR
jgi:hypothetical protein